MMVPKTATFNWSALLREPRVWLAAENLLLAINAQISASGGPAIPPAIMTLLFAFAAVVLSAALGIEIAQSRRDDQAARAPTKGFDPFAAARSRWWR